METALRGQGYRLTAQRRAVLKAIAQSHDHLTPAELHELAREQHPGIGLVTVYRTLEILHEAGLTTFRALSGATPEKLTQIVEAAGFKAPFDPSSWPQQAELAARGDWAALETLQDQLVGGREG